MKKYLVPLLVLVLLLVSVTTVFADRFTNKFNAHGVCTFIQQPPGSECATHFAFFARKMIDVDGCASHFNIYLKENGKLSPYIPDWDSEWECQARGTFTDLGGCDLVGCYHEIWLEEILLFEQIAP